LKLIHVVGARPNFVKVAPVVRALTTRTGVPQMIVHTGQHYDANMSDIFFRDLDLVAPDINLNVGPGSHVSQVARIMLALEPVLEKEQPNWVVVYGDVNSTVAAALTGFKMGFPVAHVEAGLRSFDMTMPEESNRMLTDQLSTLLFTHSEEANRNLAREGIDRARIHMTGNVMIDTLVAHREKAQHAAESWRGHAKPTILLTLHRPSSVDRAERLIAILETLARFSARARIVFPVHPRTRERVASFGAAGLLRHMTVTDPLGYLEFLGIEMLAGVVVTDSGGVQEETSFLGVPCVTVRENTERPVTVRLGTNRLVGFDMGALAGAVDMALSAGGQRPAPVIPGWDGRAAIRIADALLAA
jgi:UDP-N-acetylglucosamine 2-epimerase (non-hydrolysing)